MATQMILQMCRETNIKVMNILNEIQNTHKKEDVTEYVTTIQLVQITINGLMKSQQEFRFDSLKDLQNALKDYEALMTQLKGTGKLARFVASNRLRKKIDQANTTIHTKLDVFRKSIKKDPAAASEENSNKAQSDSSQQDQLEEEIEAKMALSLMTGIEDEDGRFFWDELFGSDNFYVNWTDFVNGLKKLLTDITDEEQYVLQYIIDNHNTGFVNKHKFSEFLKGFGPVTDCVRNVKSVLSSKWFYGFLSRAESELLLRDQPPATFLIRFSSSQPGSFALAFTRDADGHLITCHILITSCGNKGFTVQEQDNQEARYFKNLHEIVDYYSVLLQTSYNSDVPFEGWFEGDFSGGEATDALTGQPAGTFLVRFSSQVGNYAVSFVTADGQINHGLIEHEGQKGGYQIAYDGVPLVFNSLRELVEYYGDALRFPLKETNNQLHVKGTQFIRQWKVDRLKQMDEVNTVVADLFDINKPLPQTKAEGDLQVDDRVEDIVARLF